jgi:hypothetical protein
MWIDLEKGEGGSSAINILPISDLKDEHNQRGILDPADEPVISHPISPKFAQAGPLQGLSDTARVVELTQSFPNILQNAFSVLSVEVA